jgi:DoxX-like family
MKKISIFYWIVTGLMSAFMLLGAIMDVVKYPDAVAIITHLGYPVYFIPFIGVMKILGVIAVLTPRFPKLKEWAYAGLVFDTFGAIFSHLSVGDGVDKWFPAFLGLILVLGSYTLYTMRNK